MKKLLLIFTFLLSWTTTFAQPYQQAGYNACVGCGSCYNASGIAPQWAYQIEQPAPGTSHINYCDLWLDDLLFKSRVVIYKATSTVIDREERCNQAEGWDWVIGDNYLIGTETRFINMGNDDMFMDALNPACGQDYMYFDTCHNHWHIEDFMSYYLYDQCGNVISSNNKLGWGFGPGGPEFWGFFPSSGLTNPSGSECDIPNNPVGTLLRQSPGYNIPWSLKYASLTKNGCYPDSVLYSQLARDLNASNRYDSLGNLIYSGTAAGGTSYQMVDVGDGDSYFATTPGAGIHLSGSEISTLSNGYFLLRAIITPPPCVDQGINCYSDTADAWIYIDWNAVRGLNGSYGSYNPPVIAYGSTPPPPASPTTPTYTLNQPTCNYAYGILEVTSPLGSNIQYSVDGVNYQSSTLFDSLSAGSYTLIARYGPTCTSNSVGFNVNASASINPPGANVIQPTCTDSTATIIVTSPVGTSYVYSIGGTTFQNSPIFSSLAPGITYNLYVRDLTTGCTSTAAQVSINSNPALNITPTATVTQPTCTDTLGTIVITSPTGAGYLYNVSGVISTTRSGVTLDSLAGGVYYIYASNSTGCSSPTLSVIIDTITTNTLPPAYSIRQPECDSTVGTITVISPIGAGYTYSINGSTYQSSPTFYGVVPGNYSLTSRYNGCTSQIITASVDTVLSIDPLVFVITQPTCSTSTGVLQVTQPIVPGGAYPYLGFEYSIDGVFYQINSPYFYNLPPGSYTLTARRPDFPSCITDTTFTITQGGGSNLTAPQTTVTQPSCTTVYGTITVTLPVGANYTYSIGGAYQSSPIFNNLIPGTYYTTYRNNNGCTSLPKMDTVSSYYSTIFPTPTVTTRTDASPTNVNPARNPFVNVDIRGTTPACSVRVQVYIQTSDQALVPTALEYFVVNSPSNTTISGNNYIYRATVMVADLLDLANTYGIVGTKRFRVAGFRYNGPNTLGGLLNSQWITIR